MGIQREENNKYVIGVPKNKGIVAIPLSLDFGLSHKVIMLEHNSDFKATLGYNLDAPQMILLRESLKRADKVLVYRLNTGTYATCKTSQVVAIAKYTGVRGNDIKINIVSRQKWQKEWGQVSNIAVEKEWGQVSNIAVVTTLRGEVVACQVIGEKENCVENEYVKIEGKLKVGMELELSGGESNKARSEDWNGFLENIRHYMWRVMAVPTEEIKIKRKIVDLISELREVEGKGVYAVVSNFEEANHIGIISVANGVRLKGGIELSRKECTAWIAGVIANAQLGECNDLLVYEGASDTDKKLSQAQVKKFIGNGQIVFIKRSGKVVMAEDINTFKSFTPKWGETYRSNTFVRMIDIINQDIHRMMKIYYLKSIKQGRSMQESKIYFKQVCVKYIEMLQSKHILVEVNPETDIEVFFAEATNGVDVSLGLRRSELSEKVYVSILYNKLIS